VRFAIINKQYQYKNDRMINFGGIVFPYYSKKEEELQIVSFCKHDKNYSQYAHRSNVSKFN